MASKSLPAKKPQTQTNTPRLDPKTVLLFILFVWTQGKKTPNKPKFNLNGRDEHLTWPRLPTEEPTGQPTLLW